MAGAKRAFPTRLGLAGTDCGSCGSGTLKLAIDPIYRPEAEVIPSEAEAHIVIPMEDDVSLERGPIGRFGPSDLVKRIEG